MHNTRSSNSNRTPRPPEVMRRHSFVSRPTHRLAPWAQDATSYRIYTSHPSHHERITGDYGVENFSYDPAHLGELQIPFDLECYLTPELSEIVRNIMLGGAAVCTSLERIDSLNKEAVHRIAPRSSHAHLLSPRSSNSTASVGAGVEVISSPLSLTPASLSSIPNVPARQPSLKPHVPQVPVNMMGLESPPFTPYDSNVGNTPLCEPQAAPIGTAANLDVVSAQLSPLDNYDITLPTMKNNIAFETFINCMREEIIDLKYSALSRLRGYILTFRTVCIEQCRCDMVLVPEVEGVLMKWWTEIDEKFQRYGQQQRELEQSLNDTAAAFGDARGGAAMTVAA